MIILTETEIEMLSEQDLHFEYSRLFNELAFRRKAINDCICILESLERIKVNLNGKKFNLPNF